MQPLTLEALEVIVEIDRRGSFASAAEHLNKVPSALSYIVQKLEEQLGVTLFQRQGRRSVLTPAGKHLLAGGQELLHMATRLAEQTQETATGWESRIRVALDTIVTLEALMPAIQSFLARHPNVELDITEEALGGSWEALIEDRVDLLVGAGAPVPVHQGLRSEVVGQLQMIFVVAADHPLVGTLEPLQKSDLASYRWVVVHDSSRFSAPRDTGRINSKRCLYVRTIEQKIAAQVAGVGVGYLPKKRIKKELEQGVLVELALEGDNVGFQDLLIAWKTANHGKGLTALVKDICTLSNDRL